MIKLFKDITKVFDDINTLNEATITDLINDSKSTDPKRIKLSNSIFTQYKGVDSDGTLLFESDSQTESGVSYQQRIFYDKFFELLDKVDDAEEITEEDVLNILTGDVYIDCNCPSHIYWSFAYKANKNNYGLRKEMRIPKRNNTELNGSACKHTLSVLELINKSNTLFDEVSADLNNLFKKYKKKVNKEKENKSLNE